MALFKHYIGIDYSGAKTADSRLSGLRVYQASGNTHPIELRPEKNRQLHWTRRQLAHWLREQLITKEATVVGIDHGFSFPIAYFETHQWKPHWPTFLKNFKRHWPTDAINARVEDFRIHSADGTTQRAGNTRWRRLSEVQAGGAKSVFHFDVPGSVAKSTHAGLPWLLYLRQTLPDRVHFWPFDGWKVTPGQNVLAEVYPSLWSALFPRQAISGDQHDAFCIAAWLQQSDQNDTLAPYLTPSLPQETQKKGLIEGWILGVR
jgi:hypothetical protein